MDIDIFKEQCRRNYGKAVDQKHIANIMANSYKVNGANADLTIVMEELAELIQQVSKKIRGKSDQFCLIEEVADVYICLEELKIIANISTEAMDAAILTKLKRVEERTRAKLAASDDRDVSGLTDE